MTSTRHSVCANCRVIAEASWVEAMGTMSLASSLAAALSWSLCTCCTNYYCFSFSAGGKDQLTTSTTLELATPGLDWIQYSQDGLLPSCFPPLMESTPMHMYHSGHLTCVSRAHSGFIHVHTKHTTYSFRARAFGFCFPLAFKKGCIGKNTPGAGVTTQVAILSFAVLPSQMGAGPCPDAPLPNQLPAEDLGKQSRMAQSLGNLYPWGVDGRKCLAPGS